MKNGLDAMYQRPRPVKRETAHKEQVSSETVRRTKEKKEKERKRTGLAGG